MFPELLYKAFEKRSYAEDFCNGKFRFSTLEYYKNSKDSERVDKTEGVGKVKRDGEELVVDLTNRVIHSKPGISNLHVEASSRERFIICFSNPKDGTIESLPQKFGTFYVKINNPKQLFHDIEKAINNDKGLQQNPPCLEASQVRYDKDDCVGKLENKEEIRMLAWMQKPIQYADEQEYRIQFLFSGREFINSPESYTVRFGDSIDYCDIIETQP